MKTYLFLLGAVLLAGCNSGPKVVEQRQNTNAANAPQRAEKLQTTTAHTTENRPAPGANAPTGGKWSASGDPIDTSKFDAKIAEAEKAVKAKPADEAAKKALAEAYYERGFALTEARQYASALGDYRRTLKYDPTNADAKHWVEQIINIYGSLNKAYPQEGEEPPPLPFKG